jgi:PAS domain-containing protein
MASERGNQLLMPLRRLAPVEQPTGPHAVPRLLHLDLPVDDGLAAWAARVREAAEASLLIDDQARVVAMSAGCGALLGLDPSEAVGALLLDLILLVDFSATGIQLVEPELHAPPLRALKSGGMARALMRVRQQGVLLRTYDVVAVPLAGQAGAMAFLTEV